MINSAKTQLEALVHTVQCDKRFACMDTRADAPCLARDIGMEHTLLCLEPHGHLQCRYCTLTALARFCHCPVRVHFEKHRDVLGAAPVSYASSEVRYPESS